MQRDPQLGPEKREVRVLVAVIVLLLILALGGFGAAVYITLTVSRPLGMSRAPFR